MKYFLIGTDEKNRNPYNINKNRAVDIRMLTREGISTLPMWNIISMDLPDEGFFPDLICSPFILMSKSCMKTAVMYQPDIIYRGVKLWDRDSGVNRTYYLSILTRDDVIIQNEENVSGENGISKKALRALMELEILNDFSDKKGYLVIEDGKLIGIKPHLAGDGYVTVGFGDCLREGDLEFYLEPERASRIFGYLSDKTSEYDKMKETVIPVDICFEKLIQDVTPLYEKAKNDFEVKGLILSQNQLDALCIIKYQCYTIGNKAFKEILGNCDREALYDDVLEKHGKNGNFEYRTNIEMNIFFGDGSDESYETEGGLSNIIVEPLEEYYEE